MTGLWAWVSDRTRGLGGSVSDIAGLGGRGVGCFSLSHSLLAATGNCGFLLVSASPAYKVFLGGAELFALWLYGGGFLSANVPCSVLAASVQAFKVSFLPCYGYNLRIPNSFSLFLSLSFSSPLCLWFAMRTHVIAKTQIKSPVQRPHWNHLGGSLGPFPVHVENLFQIGRASCRERV